MKRKGTMIIGILVIISISGCQSINCRHVSQQEFDNEMQQLKVQMNMLN